MRYVARIEYNGSAFHGWQRQTHESSVQSAVERALSRVADESITVVCAGRTDTGVHSVGQIVHFDTAANRSVKAWVMGGNTFLCRDAAIRMVKPISDSFHARYSAYSRSYRYGILNTDTRSAVLGKRTRWIYQPLDIEAIRSGANFLIGEHDFSAFRAAGCQAKNPVRNISQIEVHRNRGFVYIDITANAFLHNMVRIIAGALIKIGKGEARPEWIGNILESRDRTIGGMTAPAHGLYFIGPSYPEQFELPVIDYLPEF